MHDKPTVLVVDDQPANVEIIAKALQGDYRLLAATSGDEALRLAESQSPDLILLDVVMPEPDGYQVCRQLKANPLAADIPVIFVTARGEEQFEAEGFEAGGVDYITKPIRPFILKARVSAHVDLKRKTDYLKQLSHLDGLTGIPNRRSLDEFLDREWRRSQRAASRLAVIMMDIDAFKPYNDNYGHAAGDDCLRQTARLLSDVIERATDQIFRYGGEEFLCVLPATDLAGTRLIGEKLREAVSQARMPHAYSPVTDHVTLSLGAASIVPPVGAKPSLLVEAADAMLYRAKEGGRNRLVCDD